MSTVEGDNPLRHFIKRLYVRVFWVFSGSGMPSCQRLSEGSLARGLQRQHPMAVRGQLCGLVSALSPQRAWRWASPLPATRASARTLHPSCALPRTSPRVSFLFLQDKGLCSVRKSLNQREQDAEAASHSPSGRADMIGQSALVLLHPGMCW